MKKAVILAVIFVLLLLNIIYAAKQEEIVFEGSLLEIKGIWFIKTSQDIYALEFDELSDKDNIIPLLQEKETIKVSGILKGEIIAATEIIRENDNNSTAEFQKEEDYQGYLVNKDKCIACRLCIKNCPVQAISMENGKAVIDKSKCIQCGICRNGDGGSWKGCPVGAIDKK